MFKLILITLAGMIMLLIAFFVVSDSFMVVEKVTAQSNIYQLATALEVYYYDNNSYPEVSDGSELLKLLGEKDYIKQVKIDGSRFNYSVLSNGQDYKLTIK